MFVNILQSYLFTLFFYIQFSSQVAEFLKHCTLEPSCFIIIINPSREMKINETILENRLGMQ